MDNPYPNAPSFHSLFQQELSEERDIINATNLSGKPWATATYQLNYNYGQNEYAINVSDWGRVLDVVKQTTNPYIPYLPVPFDDLNSMHYGTVMQWANNSYAQSWSLTETPERMSFSRQGVLNAQYMVTINPQPMESAVYIITYLPGFMGDTDPLESVIQMSEHAELVRLRGATAQLNYAKWYDDDEKNREKRKDLAAGYAYQLDRKEPIFRDYIRSINIPRMVLVEDWNS